MEKAKLLVTLILAVLLLEETDDEYLDALDRIVTFLIDDDNAGYDEDDRAAMAKMVEADLDPQRRMLNCQLTILAELFEDPN